MPYMQHPAPVRAEARILERGERDGQPWVVLDATPFYPGGGGQPADSGTIGGVPVVSIIAEGGKLLHVVERPVAGDEVAAEVDAARRLDLSQQHTAQHLLTALFLGRHGLATTAFHLGEAYTAIEVRGPAPGPGLVASVEDEANALVAEARRVGVMWVDPGDMERLGVRSRGLPEGHMGRVRLVEIEGVDLNTCGGTHVTSLAGIQMIRIHDASPGRGGTRIRFLAGHRVMKRLRETDHLHEALKARLGTGPEEFVKVVDGWQADAREAGKRAKDLEMELASVVAREIAAGKGSVLARRVQDAGPEMLKAIARSVLDARPEAVVVLVGGPAGQGRACFMVQSGSGGPGDVSDLGARVRDALGAKGGGRGRVFQGQGGSWAGGLSLGDDFHLA